jgi:hypothetical protein
MTDERMIVCETCRKRVPVVYLLRVVGDHDAEAAILRERFPPEGLLDLPDEEAAMFERMYQRYLRNLEPRPAFVCQRCWVSF